MLGAYALAAALLTYYQLTSKRALKILEDLNDKAGKILPRALIVAIPFFVFMVFNALVLPYALVATIVNRKHNDTPEKIENG